MATKELKDNVITVTTGDVSNGYVTVEASAAVDVVTMTRAGATNTVYTENSPVDGTVTIAGMSLGEVLTFIYVI